MNRLSRHQEKIRNASLICLLTLGIALSLFSNSFAAQDPQVNDLEDETEFEYQLENRNDPFLPFVKEETSVAPINMDEIVDPDDQLFGMQLFEPDQLKVVAVLSTKKRKIAMVQDIIGQGYPITIGTLIGKRGIVKEITAKGVLIEETAVTRSGTKKITTIVMALKPEGD